jgi:hypothetical protein
MEKIREMMSKPLFSGGIGLFVGLILGLIVLGWGLFPLQWTDAAPDQLHPGYKKEFLQMSIDSFVRNQDKDLAHQRWIQLGPGAKDILDSLTTDLLNNPTAAPGQITTDDISAFSSAVGSAVSLPTTSAIATAIPTNQTGLPLITTPTTSSQGQNPMGTLTFVLVGMCLLTLAIGGALVYLLVFRNRRKSTEAVDTQPKTGTDVAPTTGTASVAQTQEQPVAQFMTTYQSGDDLYDDSFSIDSPTGEFLGECGVGISDTIGVGEPKKVSAFEVWLFDKNDIQTVTKVLMSANAFEDAAVQQRLASKGEPVLVEPAKHIILETATLHLEARVVDTNYGQSPLPANSYFDRMTLELAVWPKSQPKG